MDSTEKNVKIKRRAAEIFRFLLSGGIATLLDYATYWVMRYLVLHDGLFVGSEGWKIFSAVVATTLGFLVGAVVNWVLSVKFVFKDTTKDVRITSKKPFFLFLLIAFLGLAITQAGVALGVWLIPEFPLFGSYQLLSVAWNEWLVKGVMTCLVLIFNYFARKRFIFQDAS